MNQVTHILYVLSYKPYCQSKGYRSRKLTMSNPTRLQNSVIPRTLCWSTNSSIKCVRDQFTEVPSLRVQISIGNPKRCRQQAASPCGWIVDIICRWWVWELFWSVPQLFLSPCLATYVEAKSVVGLGKTQRNSNCGRNCYRCRLPSHRHSLSVFQWDRSRARDTEENCWRHR